MFSAVGCALMPRFGCGKGIERRCYGVCQGGWILDRNHPARRSDDERRVARIRAYARRAAGHRFGQRIREGLALARQHVDIERVHDRGNIIATTKQADA